MPERPMPNKLQEALKLKNSKNHPGCKLFHYICSSKPTEKSHGKDHENRDRINEALGDAYRGSLASKQLATATI